MQPVSHIANGPLENGWKIARNTFYRFSSIFQFDFCVQLAAMTSQSMFYDYIKYLLQPNWTRGREEEAAAENDDKKHIHLLFWWRALEATDDYLRATEITAT